MNRKFVFKSIKLLTLSLALCAVPQQSDAQIIGLGTIAKGAKLIKGANAKKKYDPLKEKAEEALQKGDLSYLITDECMIELPEQGNKLTGNALSDWQNLDKKIKGFLYVELHTIDKANFCENVNTLIGKATSAQTTEMKALYVDAAIGVLKGMMAYNYDVQSNRSQVVAACNSVKSAWNSLPSSYKPYAVSKDADIRDPRFLHNLRGGVPSADDIIAYQEKSKKEKADAEAKKQASEAQELANRKAMFAKGSSSCGFYVSVQKAGTANLERVDIANIESGKSSFNIREKGGTSSIGKFVLDGNEYKVYKGTSLIGYISEDCQFYDYNRNRLGVLNSSGKAYDKNGYTLGEVSSSTVKYGTSYIWNSTSSISTKLFPAALFLFFNKEFANYINVKDYYAH